MIITITAIELMLRSLLGVIATPEITSEILAGANGSCARFASIVTVCYRESNLGMNPRERIPCGAMNVRDGGVLDRSYAAQIGEVARVFGTTTRRDVLARKFADWRCGGRAPRCVSTIGASYAETSLPIWQRVYGRCRSEVIR